MLLDFWFTVCVGVFILVVVALLFGDLFSLWTIGCLSYYLVCLLCLF